MDIYQTSDSSVDRYRNSIMARQMQRQKQIQELETQQELRQMNQERSFRNSGFNNTIEKNSKRNSLSYSNPRGSVQEFRISLKDLTGGEPRIRGPDTFNPSKENPTHSPLSKERAIRTTSGKNSPSDNVKRRRHSSSKVSHLFERGGSNSPNPESNRQYTEQSAYILERENRDLQKTLQSEIISSEKQRLKIEMLKQMLTSNMKDLRSQQSQEFKSLESTEVITEYSCLKKKHHQLLIDYESLKETLMREEEQSSSLVHENLKLKKECSSLKHEKENLEQELQANRALKDEFVRNEEDKKSLLAFLNEKIEEASAVKRESSGLQKKLEGVEKENQLLIEKCLRYTVGTESKEDEVVKLKKKYQDLSKDHAELQLANVELENTKTKQGRALAGLEKKISEITEENKRLEELLTQLRDEVNRLDNERRVLEKGFINEIEKRDERYIALRKKVENKANENELAIKEIVIKELESKSREQKRIIEELNEKIQLLASDRISLESKLKASTPQEDQLRAKLIELNKANEELTRKKEEVKILQGELIKLQEQSFSAQEKLTTLQRELREKESSCNEKDSRIAGLKEQAQTSKEKIEEQDDSIVRLKTEINSLKLKLQTLEKQCAEQRKELDTASSETKELRSTLIAALENANKTENLRKIEHENAQHNMITLEKQIDRNSNHKELSNVLLLVKSALTTVLESSQAYKAIYCSVSESFRQLINKELLWTDKLQELPSSEQNAFVQHLFTIVFTEIKLLSLKIIDTENKIIKLNTQSLELDEKLLTKSSTSLKIYRGSRNPSLSLAESFCLEKENLRLETKSDLKISNTGETSISDLISESNCENMMTEGSTLMKTPPDQSVCHLVLENNTNGMLKAVSQKYTEKGRTTGSKKIGKINLKNLRPKQRDDSSLDNIHELELRDLQAKGRVNCSPAPKIIFRQEVPKTEIKKS